MIRKGIIWVVLVILCGCTLLASDCRHNNGAVVDPLKEKAREKYSEGRRLFLTCDPNNYKKSTELFEAALAYWEDYPEALAAWTEAVSMWYAFNMPEELFQRGYMNAQRSVRLDPSLDIGYRAMADLFRHHHDPETGVVQTDYAKEVIERALRINPNSAENLYVKGSIFLAEDPEKALEILQQARMINPDLGKIYFNLASAHQMIANNLKQKHKDDPDKLEELANQINGHQNKAIQHLETYQRLVPGDLAGYCSMGIAYLQQGEVDEAEMMFQKAVSQNQKPDPSQDLWRQVSYIQMAFIEENKRDNLDKANFLFEKALEITPRDVKTINHLIRVNTKLKDEKAVEEYKKRLEGSIKSLPPSDRKAGTVDKEDKESDTVPP